MLPTNPPMTAPPAGSALDARLVAAQYRRLQAHRTAAALYADDGAAYLRASAAAHAAYEAVCAAVGAVRGSLVALHAARRLLGLAAVVDCTCPGCTEPLD